MKRGKSVSRVSGIRSGWTRAVVRALFPAALLLFSAVSGHAQMKAATNHAPRKKLYNPPYPNEAVKPFRIIGNIYYVGMQNYTSYLIKTSDGLMLLDMMTDPEAPVVRKGIQDLGFKLTDVKILLQAHAHVDHVGGLAKMKELTGGKVVVMAEDVDVLADGGKTDFRGDGSVIWKPVRADQIIHDKDKIQLGGVTKIGRASCRERV